MIGDLYAPRNPSSNHCVVGTRRGLGWYYVEEWFIEPNDLRRALDNTGTKTKRPARPPRKREA